MASVLSLLVSTGAQGQSSPPLPASEIVEACKQFTPYQMSDPANPCYEQIRSNIDEKIPEGIHNDRHMVRSHKDECGGCHDITTTLTEDTVNNVYGNPNMKATVIRPGSSSSGGASGSSNSEGGTD